MISVALPDKSQSVVLHACCAPCSSAILECLVANDIRPVVFYYNPNIFPQKEYEIRKAESKRQVSELGLDFVDGDYDHAAWLTAVRGLENEPERGLRCSACFRHRLKATALLAQQLGIGWITTTLASSRWKNKKQIDEAGLEATALVDGVKFWTQDWRKGGLTERRAQLLREGGFYNQRYCGCEFSFRE